MNWKGIDMAMQPIKSVVLMFAVLPLAVFAQDHDHGGNSAPYAGFETRDIKSLSEKDIDELRRGGAGAWLCQPN